ncbi:MAG TPA: SDR family NAD(P)-dependent oxidoreductase [Actinophytocola sp.]|uniref:SDR family NAD(P)-dependent oxidoreductase n=1 Tax=Actinophytocola sp. TaxID=1872138 RepID=UPI002DDDA424|nr:SDR family NAD(P)-dependent oxidoreductase [Actinophytocola sp.]HEV2780610.1 SDR family NAD(P)-dependent oxidoreductase [Actinophytocola sp.]
MRITDTAAIVTGGASGLGNATARALAGAGAQVFGLDLPAAIEKAEPVAGITYLPADVTDAAEVQSAVDTAAGSGAPLRVAVNCAGVGWAGRIVGKTGPHDLELFRKVVDVNLVGTFNVIRLAATAIAKTEPGDHGQRGVIINTASIAAFDGQIGQVAYAASKGGVVGLTLSAARDLASFGIRVVTIAPGIIDTPMLAGVTEEFRASLAANVPFPKRLGQPTEYAKLALSIIDQDYLNGEVIRLDGALRMAPR